MDAFLKTIIDVESKKVGKSTLLMFATNASLGKFSGVLSEHGVTHFASNRLIGSGDTNIRLKTIWGAKGGEAEIAALIADSDMDFNMLSEDPRLEYVAHTRAKESFYYVGRFAAPVPEQPEAPADNANTQKTVSAEATLSPDSVSQLLKKFGRTNR